MKNSKEDAGKQHEKGTSNKQSSAKGDNTSSKESVGSKKSKDQQAKESSKK